jgi:hypothetical protein
MAFCLNIYWYAFNLKWKRHFLSGINSVQSVLLTRILRLCYLQRKLVLGPINSVCHRDRRSKKSVLPI